MSTPTPTPAPAPTADRPTTLQRHPLLWFFALCYAVAWAIETPLVILGADRTSPALGLTLVLLASCVPSAVGLAMVGVRHGRPGVRNLLRRLIKGRVGLRWYLAVLLVPLIVPVSIAVSVFLGAERPTIDRTVVGILVLLAFSIFPGSAMGEELGWRGVALPGLQARHSALSASLIVGALWGFWHLPLFLTGLESRPLNLFPAFFLSVVATSVILTWMYNGTGGSLLIVVLAHATLNLPVTVILEPMGSRLTQPFLIYTAVIVCIAAVLALVAGPKRLSRTHARQVTPDLSRDRESGS